MSEPDYRAILDAEIWAYIERSAQFYPPGAVALSVGEQRATYDAMCAVFHRGRPDTVRCWDEPWGGVPCRRYEAGASAVTVIYYHGGGFVVGGLDSHDDICAEICDRTGYRVISVDYSLAPEVIFPGCFNDAWAAFAAIEGAYPGPLVLAGDSAGGSLAAAVSHAARQGTAGRIAGQLLIYAALGGDGTTGASGVHANAPELTLADVKFYNRTRAGGDPPFGDPRFYPLQDSDFSGLPPSVMITAACDPVAIDSEAYRDVIRAAGGRAVWFNEAGLVHGCLRARGMSRRAAAFFDRVVAGVDALGRGALPEVEAAA